MDAKHTSGPWEVKSDPMHYDSLTTVEGGRLKRSLGLHRELLVQVGGWAEWDEAEANTRLIAAAPDLLNALRTLAEVANSRGIPTDAANAAVAKALHAPANA